MQLNTVLLIQIKLVWFYTVFKKKSVPKRSFWAIFSTSEYELVRKIYLSRFTHTSVDIYQSQNEWSSVFHCTILIFLYSNVALNCIKHIRSAVDFDTETISLYHHFKAQPLTEQEWTRAEDYEGKKANESFPFFPFSSLRLIITGWMWQRENCADNKICRSLHLRMLLYFWTPNKWTGCSSTQPFLDVMCGVLKGEKDSVRSFVSRLSKIHRIQIHRRWAAMRMVWERERGDEEKEKWSARNPGKLESNRSWRQPMHS